MEKIFSKSDFPKAPGGNLYEWKNAEVNFKISKEGLYLIKIAAKAKSAKQNNSTDDDDLRIALDEFNFGKYEIHDEDISWKGFGTSASWNGATLKGGTKTIYFFVELKKGFHRIQFFADMKPYIISLEVLEVENSEFELNNLKPTKNIQTKNKGIPWLSFIFFGSYPKNIVLDVNTKSSNEKGGNDGDNLKVLVNGKIQHNKQAPTSKKYKNFYFSGDIGAAKKLSISNEAISDPLAFENSIELWYDESPEIFKFYIHFFDTDAFLEKYKDLIDLQKYVLNVANLSRLHFSVTRRTYSKKFLNHALKSNPSNLIFKSNHPIVRKIKTDPAYNKICVSIKENLDKGVVNGQIYPRDIVFESHDLDFSLHGVKKIDFSATKNKDQSYKVYFTLYDVYDFARKDAPFGLIKIGDYFKQQLINTLDTAEKLGILSNFEIQVHISDIF